MERAWLKFDNNFDEYKKYKNNKIIDKYYGNREISKWMQIYFEKSIDNKDNIWSTNWSYTILKNDGLCISPMKKTWLRTLVSIVLQQVVKVNYFRSFLSISIIILE